MLAILTIGIPGCGKSTWAAKLNNNFEEVNLDDLRAVVNGDATVQANIGEVIAKRDEIVAAYARLGKNVVLSDTNVNPQFRPALVAQLRELGYQVILAHFAVSLETCKERNAARDRVVPEHVLERMAGMLAGNPPLASEADDLWVVR